MKKLLVLILLGTSLSASAATWWVNGILFGNVCRNGLYYTVYPMANGQPVGTQCPLRDIYGNIVGQGVVSNE